jgi:hypothetical protein
LTGGADKYTFFLGGKGEDGEDNVYYNDGNFQEQGLGDYALVKDLPLVRIASSWLAHQMTIPYAHLPMIYHPV